MNAFNLRIATPYKDVYSGEAEYLSVQATDGRMGFMRGALRRIVLLRAGTLEVTFGGVTTVYECGDGILRITSDGITVLTSDCRDRNDGERASVEQIIASKNSSKEYKYAKARIESNISDINKKHRLDD